MAGNLTDEPRPRAVPLPWAPYVPKILYTETLPIPSEPISREFYDVLRSRHSSVGGSLRRLDLSVLLWFAVGVKGYSASGRSGLPIEWAASPSAGALRPISTICVPEDADDGIALYEPRLHAMHVIDVNAAAIVGQNAQDLSNVVGSKSGCTLRFFADVDKVNAAYESPMSLVLRDAGCLISVICLCAEWLGLSACPLGFLGQNCVEMAKFPTPRFQAVGGVLISARTSLDIPRKV